MNTVYCEKCGEEPIGLLFTCAKCTNKMCSDCFGDTTQDNCFGCVVNYGFVEEEE